MMNLYLICFYLIIFAGIVICMFLTLGKKHTDNYTLADYDKIKQCKCKTYKELDVERLETIVESSRIFNKQA